MKNKIWESQIGLCLCSHAVWLRCPKGPDKLECVGMCVCTAMGFSESGKHEIHRQKRH